MSDTQQSWHSSTWQKLGNSLCQLTKLQNGNHLYSSAIFRSGAELSLVIIVYVLIVDLCYCVICWWSTEAINKALLIIMSPEPLEAMFVWQCLLMENWQLPKQLCQQSCLRLCCMSDMDLTVASATTVIGVNYSKQWAASSLIRPNKKRCSPLQHCGMKFSAGLCIGPPILRKIDSAEFTVLCCN